MSLLMTYERLIYDLKSLGSCLVALSGGLDSTLLLKAAKDALGDKVTAITVSTPYVPSWEISEAVEIAAALEIKHRIVRLPVPDAVSFNPSDRCYHCKKYLFEQLKREAERENIPHVLEGTNADDLKDYRPGFLALKELDIVSPLLWQGLTKQDIRDLSRHLGLPNWQKPPCACLLSRIPYDREITLQELARIEMAEKYLMDNGFMAVRVRSDGPLARIEVGREERKIFFDEDRLDTIARELKAMGYTYVAMELEGYQIGSMNRTLTVGNIQEGR